MKKELARDKLADKKAPIKGLLKGVKGKAVSKARKQIAKHERIEEGKKK